MKRFVLLFLALQLILIPLNSQEVTQEEYKRAVSFMYDNYNNKTVFNLKTKVNWFKDVTGLWFIDYSKDKKTYKLVDFKNNKVVDLFNHNKMARDEIVQFINQEKDKLNEVERDQITISMKVDVESKMGIVSDVQQELREANARKILYSSVQAIDI